MIHTTAHEPDITIIRPGAQRLTAQNAKVFKDEVIDLINEGSTQLVIDFQEVSFLDSSGLGALVGVLKKVGHRGEVVVCGLNTEVEQMFRICRMDRVFNIYPNVKMALQTLSERS
ncbi:STAS domain-containing protein [Pseudorhodobacter sp. W20_MBD10_FR17]|uniref:STAS domain-containing protein n=1 Tax=Pseudorhodobacter sp. W20_MBD10_FR17 TaxID=3240266 RepID=UPI003F9C8AE2